VRQCVKEGANKIRVPAPTVLGPRPAQRPEHTSVAMDPTVVLWQACVLVNKGLHVEPAFPNGSVGSDGKFWECAPLPQLLGLGAPFWIDTSPSAVTPCQYRL